jgi:uncharacterized protein YndB with AHSA1/START domain
MLAGNSLAAGASDREIVTTRVFDAPLDLLFEAGTCPEQLDAWWGPKGFTTTPHVRGS